MPAIASTDAVVRKLTADGDLDISAGRSQFLAGIEAFVVGANARMKLVRGELFSDRTRGMPYVENDYVLASAAILGQPFDEGKARLAYTAAIGETPGFGAMLSMAITFNATTRRQAVTWQARTQFGDTPVVVQEF
jgi:hypothetical protein